MATVWGGTRKRRQIVLAAGGMESRDMEEFNTLSSHNHSKEHVVYLTEERPNILARNLKVSRPSLPQPIPESSRLSTPSVEDRPRKVQTNEITRTKVKVCPENSPSHEGDH